MTSVNFVHPLSLHFEIQLWELYQNISNCNAEPIGGSWGRNQIKEALELEEVVGALSVESGELLAFLIYVRQLQSCDILLLGVHSAHRRKGIMSGLLSFFIESIPGDKYYVEVHEKNRSALAFYRSHQFCQVGFRRDFYGQGESAYLLALEV